MPLYFPDGDIMAIIDRKFSISAVYIDQLYPRVFGILKFVLLHIIYIKFRNLYLAHKIGVSYFDNNGLTRVKRLYPILHLPDSHFSLQDYNYIFFFFKRLPQGYDLHKL